MIYGIGIDSVDIRRIELIYDKRPEALINRILTPSERKQFNEIKKKQRKMEWLAGRFSAKEAMSKAIGSGIGKTFDFQDGEILNAPNAKPMFYLSEKTKSLLPSDIKIHISITHTKTTASSMVTLDKD